MLEVVLRGQMAEHIALLQTACPVHETVIRRHDEHVETILLTTEGLHNSHATHLLVCSLDYHRALAVHRKGNLL